MLAFLRFDLGHFLNLDYLRNQQAAIEAWRAGRPIQVALVFFLAYVAVTALSLPGAVVMTLVGGAIFGLLWGTVLVSFASAGGATLAFLVSRFLLRDWVQQRFRERLHAINRSSGRIPRRLRRKLCG